MKMITECADKLAHLGEKLFNETEMKTIKTGTEYFVELPEGYQFVDENGNVVEAKKIVLEKKKPKYPKTFEECAIIMRMQCKWRMVNIKSNDGSARVDYYEVPLAEKMDKFMELIVCRDAYWKLAGDWKPDWAMYSGPKHCIIYSDNQIKWQDKSFVTEAKLLAFPTKEMRDAFYENFKGLIEECKELI